MKDSICREFLKRVEHTPAWPAYRVGSPGHAWKTVTFADLRKITERMFLFLLHQGLERDQCVAILAENSPEWVAVDMAIMACGAIVVPVYPTSTPDQVAYILSHCEASGIVVSTRSQAEKVLPTMEQSETLRWMVILEDGGEIVHDRVFSFRRALSDRAGRTDGEEENMAIRIREIDDAQTCLMIYTSGTTGPPKGVMLNHRSILYVCRSVLHDEIARDRVQMVSYLPMCHVSGLFFDVYIGILLGSCFSIASQMEIRKEELKAVRPIAVNGVPRLYEKAYRVIAEEMQGHSIRARMLRKAVQIAQEYAAQYERHKKRPGVLPRIRRWVVDKSILRSLRIKAFGGDIQFMGTGAAPIAPDLIRFFLAIGVLMLEGYGQTESSGLIARNVFEPGGFKVGTVGKVIAGTDIRIARDGEILIKGPGVMQGYYKDPDATAKTIVDGWLHTGDLGTLDAEGFLRITGRKKDIIVTSGGKNITPSNIESLVKMDAFIDDFVVYGDRRKYLTGILVPNFESLEQWAKEVRLTWTTLDELLERPEVQAMFRDRMHRINATLPSYQTIKKFVLISRGLTVEHGEITPTRKLRRRNIYRNFQKQLDALYPTEDGLNAAFVHQEANGL